MKAFKKELELISLINNNYVHIVQLETLAEHYQSMVESDYSKQCPSEYCLTQEEIDNLYIITITTINSHYDMRLYTDTKFQNKENIVDKALEKVDKKPMRSWKQEVYATH